MAADLIELRRGDCTARCDGTVCTDTDGLLSICLDGEYISRPVRVGGVAPDNTASLVFCPIPTLDPRWADLDSVTDPDMRLKPPPSRVEAARDVRHR